MRPNSAVTLGNGPGNAERLDAPVRAGTAGDEGHLAVVIDLGQARQLGRRQLAQAGKDAKAHIFRVERMEEFQMLLTALRTCSA